MDAAVDGDASPGPLGAPIAIDLGTVSAGAPVKVAIPSGTLGFNVVVRRAGGGQVGVERITSPSNQDVVTGFTVVGAGAPTAIASSGIAAASVPQNPLSSAMPVEPGEWELVFQSPTPGEPLNAKVWVQKTDDGAFHGGVLDLHVYIPVGLQIADPGPSHVVSADDAAADPSVSTRIDAFFDGLAALHGIGRGEVSFVALGAEHKTIIDYAGLDAAFSNTTAPKNGTAVHVLLANGVSLFGQDVWGISTGLPGGAVEVGHPASGIALNVSAGFPAVGDGWTLVHELGHFAGLFHTSQPDGAGGTMHDPLSDTDQCPTYPTNCPDGSNIMFAAFWGGSGGVGIVASDQQRAIVRGSPLYRAYLSGPVLDQQRAPPPSAELRRVGALPRELCGHALRR